MNKLWKTLTYWDKYIKQPFDHVPSQPNIFSNDIKRYRFYFHKGNGPPDYGINVIPAWNKCYNGTGVTVGVVDTGIDTSNPDLQNQVVSKTDNIYRHVQECTID